MLKYKLSSEDFESADESVKGLYKQEGNVYILAVEGLDNGDVAGLKAQNERLLSEKKEAERKAAEAARFAQEEAERTLKENGDFKQLFESAEAKNKELAEKLESMQAQTITQRRNAEAAKLAASLTKDTARAELLSEKIAARLAVTDDGIKVLDENGQLTVSKPEELISSIKERYAFLVDGRESSGGAANGSTGGAGGGKTVSRSDFDSMGHSERASFFKEGGKIQDD